MRENRIGQSDAMVEEAQRTDRPFSLINPSTEIHIRHPGYFQVLYVLMNTSFQTYEVSTLSLISDDATNPACSFSRAKQGEGSSRMTRLALTLRTSELVVPVPEDSSHHCRPALY